MKARFTFILILGVLLVTGCTGQPSPTGFQPTDTSLPTTPPGMTRTATLAQTTTSTLTPRPSPSPTNTLTPVPPTWTPLPTLPPEEAQKLVIELTKTNGRCALPCWWGITPGETTFQEAHQFLSTFADKIVIGEPEIIVKDGIEYTQFKYSARFLVPGYINVFSGYGVTNGIIDSIEIYPGTELRYQLFQMLNRYGVPEEVLINVEPDSPLGAPYFWMAVFYPQKGIYAFFEGETKLQDGKVLICSQGLGPTLILIPMDGMTLDEMERTFLDLNVRASMRSIKRATGMELEDFYTELKNPGACIQVTPFDTSLWPLY